MVKKILLGIGIVVVIFAVYFGYLLAANRILSPAEIVKTEVNGAKISVSYSRPFKREREIFGGLVPYDKYWRTGANEATEITFSKDVLFGTKKVEAGSYWLYSIPGKREWTVVLNSELGQWGVPGPNYDKDILRIKVKATSVPEPLEQFKISLVPVIKDNGVKLTLCWDKTLVVVPLEVI